MLKGESLLSRFRLYMSRCCNYSVLLQLQLSAAAILPLIAELSCGRLHDLFQRA